MKNGLLTGNRSGSTLHLEQQSLHKLQWYCFNTLQTEKSFRCKYGCITTGAFTVYMAHKAQGFYCESTSNSSSMVYREPRSDYTLSVNGMYVIWWTWIKATRCASMILKWRWLKSRLWLFNRCQIDGNVSCICTLNYSKQSVICHSPHNHPMWQIEQHVSNIQAAESAM